MFYVAGGDGSEVERSVCVRPSLSLFACSCGTLTRARQTSALTVLRSDAPDWVYLYTNPAQPGEWTQILPKVFSGDGKSKNSNGVEHEVPVPLPRCAHQVSGRVGMRVNGGVVVGKENEEARVGGAQASQGAKASVREVENSGGSGDGTGSGSWRGGGLAEVEGDEVG